jgi:Kef-type K+ transport system membrane component KefB
MEQIWFVAAVWIALALAASLISVRIGISVALVEILVGTLGGNILHLHPTDWINVLAGFGSVLLTFLAGAEIDPVALRKQWKASLAIGFVSFLGPFLGAMAYTYWVAGWSLPASEIAGIALSTTSVAVVYAVMVERGYNETDLGKLILSACFITDLGTVLALGLLFAHYDLWLLVFIIVLTVVLWLAPRFTPWFFSRAGSHISEPETKYILILLFALGALATIAGSEAVLPAYLIGMVLAPVFLANRTLSHRIRVMTFTLLTPFYFLKAGVLVNFRSAMIGAGLILILLAVKIIAKFLGVWPLTHVFRFGRREGMYTTLLMSTGLTFGTISALYGLSHQFITQEQYTILVTVVILSAVVPTLIAERWFDPGDALRAESSSDDGDKAIKMTASERGAPFNKEKPHVS